MRFGNVTGRNGNKMYNPPFEIDKPSIKINTNSKFDLVMDGFIYSNTQVDRRDFVEI